MAYNKQGNSRDDKSAESNRRAGKASSSGRSFSSSSKNENSGGEGSFRKKPSAFGAPKKSFSGAKGTSEEKKFGRPSAENNRFKNRDNSNASFSSKKTDDDKPFRKSGSAEGRPFKERSFSDKPSFGPRTDKPFNSRGTGDFKAKPSFGSRTDKPFKSRETGDFKAKPSFGPRTDKPFKSRGTGDFKAKPAFGARTEKPFKSRNTDDFQEGRSRDRSFKSSDSEGRPYEKDFGSKRYVRNDDTTEKKPIMRSRNKPADGASRTKDDGTIRLNRYIANAGICSRRKADELIEAGVVSVNGEVVSNLGAKIDPIKDVIRYNGETLKREKMVYVLLNKPKDYITTTDDPQERRTVMQLVEKASRERIYPVGRLDRNTTGLLLMTNDGDLADKLSHPRNSITKIYNIELDKSLTQGDLNKITYGLELEDGLIKPDAVSYVTGGTKREVGIQIHSGKNRIVRRIFEHLGYEVVKLDRVIYGNLTKKDLTRGRWRYLDEKEVIQLKHLIK
jgi:23S rRNA pseudouridine2605 synthase